MKITHLLSKIILVAAFITTGIHANVYLSNNSMWNIEFKFAEPSRNNAKIIQLLSGSEFILDNVNEIVHLSIKRSGIGSSLSPWTELNLDSLRLQMKEFLANRPQETIANQHLYDQHFRWSITSTNTGWNVKVIGFRTRK